MRKILKTFVAMLVCLCVTATVMACEPQNTDNNNGNNDEDKIIMSDNEILNKLSTDVYSSNIDSLNNLGLSDISAIGVNKGTHGTAKYPVPADNQFSSVYNVTDYGVSLAAANNSTALNNFLSSIKDVQGLKKVFFPQGTYNFNRTINLSGMKDLYFCGDNVDFLMSSWTTALSLSNCENVYINGINIDYNPSPVVSGVIKSCNMQTKTIVISLYDEFNLSNSFYKGGTITYGSYMEFVWDEVTKKYTPDENGNLKYNSTGDRINSITSGTYTTALNELTLTFTDIKQAQEGVPVSVAFTMYEYPGTTIKNCKNIYFESCNYYTTPGMAILSESSKNLYFNNTNLMLKPGSKRLMTATADGLHSKDCYGDFQLTNSIFEYSHDDSINVCSFYKRISSNQGRTITCAASALQFSYPIEKGDVIEIYNLETFELKGIYTVVDVTSSMLTYTLTVDKVITQDLSGCLVGNTTRTPSLFINNNIFRNKRNRGILAQVRNSEISDNTFINIIHGAISVHSVLDIFSEAIVPKNMVIKNNKFISNNGDYGLEGDVSIFARGTKGTASGAIKGIEVSNNFFFNNGQAGVSMLGVGESTVKNNLFYDIVRKFSNPDLNSAIRLNTCNDITVQNNGVIFSQPKQSFNVLVKKNVTFITENGNGIIALDNN